MTHTVVPQTPPNPPSDFKWEIDEETGGVTIIRFLDETATACVVPDEIDGRPVTKIGCDAFSEHDSLESVKLPNGVKVIERDAFCFCYSLTSIEFPNDLELIAEEAFFACDSLTSLEFPPNLKSIESNAFFKCQSLKSVAFPKNLRIIDDEAFRSCESLTSLNLPDELEFIGKSAFENCKALMTVATSKKLKIVGAFAFQNCASLTTFTISDDLEIIEQGAFNACSQLAEFNVSSNSRRFKLVDGVLFTKGGKKLIAYFENLRPLDQRNVYVVPDGVETIQGGAFCECAALTSVVFPKGLKTIGEDAFCGCAALTSVAFPKSLKTIGEGAFCGCAALTSIAFPVGVKTVGQYAFTGCSRLTEFKASPASRRFKLVDGVLFSKDGKTLVAYFEKLRKSDRRTTYKIPDGVETIQGGAFYGCESLTSVALPNSLKTLNDFAFDFRASSTETAFSDEAPNPEKRAGAGFAIYGAVGSIAEEYAISCGFRFIPR